MRVPVSYQNEIPLYLFCRLAILYILYILYIVHLHHCSIKFNTLQSKQHLDICMISYVLFPTTYCYISLLLLFWHKKKKSQTRKSQTQLECFCLLLTAWNQTAFVDRIQRFMFTQVSQRDGGWLWKRKCSCHFVLGVIISLWKLCFAFWSAAK